MCGHAMMDVNRIHFIEQVTPFTSAEDKLLENGDVLPSDGSTDSIEVPSPQWRESFASWDELLQEPQVSPARIIFAPTGILKFPVALRQKILRRFEAPEYLFSAACQWSNGYLWCHSMRDQAGKMTGRNLSFRTLVKHTEADAKPSTGYSWYEMSFLISALTSGKTLVICFEVPQVYRTGLHSALARHTEAWDTSDPFIVCRFIMDEIITAYDLSIWNLRDHIRKFEKAHDPTKPPNPDYGALHDVARHAIHTVETLEAAVDTMTAIYQRRRETLEATGCHETTFDQKPNALKMLQAHSYENFQLQILRGLCFRSQANAKRIHNEISYAYNAVAQSDSHVMVRVGSAAQQDSAAMRTISVVTMIFLPATFVSALYSMSFFNFTPGNGKVPDKWSVSGQIWVYGTTVTLLTALTLGVWYYWYEIGGCLARIRKKLRLARDGLLPK